MSFVDLLRQSRSSPVSILHKFLSQYDPSSDRVYAFVEGEPDEVFYRTHIRRHVSKETRVITLNCRGKRRVYEAYRDVAKRYPGCRRVLFFVDKDVDDYVGISYPADPRIHTTEHYSIENYIISSGACDEYFGTCVKLKKIDFDREIIIRQIFSQRTIFQRKLLPLMAWVICCRRDGGRVVLNDLNLGNLFAIVEAAISKRRTERAVSYLLKFADLAPCGGRAPSSKAILAMCRHLSKFDPRAYTRGHFEAWWFVASVKSACASIEQLAKESGGSVSYSSPLEESNLVELFSEWVDTPSSLQRFLMFHMVSAVPVDGSSVPPKGIVNSVRRIFGL